MRAQAGAGVVGVDPRGEPDVVEGERALEAGGVPRGRVDGRIDLEERDAHDGGAGRPALEVERSEERRVGKECRSRWAPTDYKRKARNTLSERKRGVRGWAGGV